MIKSHNIFNLLHESEAEPAGTFGFNLFDEEFGELTKGQLVVVGGRSGMGKTRLLIHMAAQNICKGATVLYLMFGQNKPGVWTMLANDFVGRPLHDTNEYSDEQLKEVDKIKNYLYSSELPYVNFDDLALTIEPLLKARSIDMLIIDGVQSLKHATYQRQNDQLRYIMNEIRLWTMRYQLPIVLSSQLSRNVEYRAGDKRPYLSDLYGCSELEELADTVVMIHRPDYYGITEDELGNSLISVTELIVLKNRQGRCGDLRLHFDKETHKLIPFADKFREQELSSNMTYKNIINEFDLEEDGKVDPPF